MRETGVVAKMSRAEHLVSVLSRGGIHSTQSLSKEIGESKEEVRKLVAKTRKQFNNGNKNIPFWVFRTSGGYTADSKPEHAAFEMRMRMAYGFGVLSNGQHVYKTLKKLNYKMFDQVRVEYKPVKPLIEFLLF